MQTAVTLLLQMAKLIYRTEQRLDPMLQSRAMKDTETLAEFISPAIHLECGALLQIVQ